MPTDSTSALKRTLGLPHATAMVVGIILGASIFVQPSEITRHVPSAGGMLGVWALCGLLAFCGALVCAELSSAFPKTGGVYVFLTEAYSPVAGFLWGWAMFWTMHSGIIAAMSVVFARYVAHFFPADDGGIRGIAIGAIWVLSAINYLGVRQGSVLQLALTIAKVAAVALMLVLAFALAPDVAPNANGATTATEHGLREFGLAMVAGLFAFGGWHMVTYAAGETRDPEKTIPRALLFGTLIVTLCYVGLNAAYLRVLPIERLAASERVAADAAMVVAGPRGGAVISALVILSTFGALAGVILAGPRVYYAMAQDGLLFRWFGAVHPRHQTPHRTILLQAAWSSLLVATETYRALFGRVIYTEWIFFALLAGATFVLRRRAGYQPAYRVWGYPWTPLLFIIVSLGVVLNRIAADPKESAVGLGLVLAGLPLYLLWARHKEQGAANARD